MSKKIDIRKLAKFVWEVQRQYNIMLDDYDDPRELCESWEECSHENQGNFVEKTTQMLYGGPERIDEMLADMDKQIEQQREAVNKKLQTMDSEQDKENEKLKFKIFLENCTEAKIGALAIKPIISNHKFTDKDFRDIDTNWLH